MIRALIFLGLFSAAMVGAMVRFNEALVLDDSKRAEHRTLWGVLYVGLWIGVSYALWDVIRHERALTTADWAALALAPVGWLTFNAFWLAAWGAIEERNAQRRGAEPPPRAVLIKRRGWRLTIAGLAIVLVLVIILGAT
ncbi:MAG: hypothetical protein A3H97_18225 [Acidobacteria bacterium RIFCSPLOWO2_02_FULL_65_29]|nr:MAG: hypothetical protein A3H97_18225 [Acidobacteria bacterium RIFCSPLOWO2_02_FULL_65_29]